jgi:hypothetical protein
MSHVRKEAMNERSKVRNFQIIKQAMLDFYEDTLHVSAANLPEIDETRRNAGEEAE